MLKPLNIFKRFGRDIKSINTFIISDIKNVAQSLSSYAPNTRIARDLNTIKQSQSWASMGSNSFILADGGAYRINVYTHWHCGSNQRVQASIYNKTTNETVIMNSDRSSSSSREPIHISAPIIIPSGIGNQEFEIGFISESNQGVHSGGRLLLMDGEVEYTRVEVERIGNV
jgi:hypothetical protein